MSPCGDSFDGPVGIVRVPDHMCAQPAMIRHDVTGQQQGSATIPLMPARGVVAACRQPRQRRLSYTWREPTALIAQVQMQGTALDERAATTATAQQFPGVPAAACVALGDAMLLAGHRRSMALLPEAPAFQRARSVDASAPLVPSLMPRFGSTFYSLDGLQPLTPTASTSSLSLPLDGGQSNALEQLVLSERLEAVNEQLAQLMNVGATWSSGVPAPTTRSAVHAHAHTENPLAAASAPLCVPPPHGNNPSAHVGMATTTAQLLQHPGSGVFHNMHGSVSPVIHHNNDSNHHQAVPAGGSGSIVPLTTHLALLQQAAMSHRLCVSAAIEHASAHQDSFSDDARAKLQELLLLQDLQLRLQEELLAMLLQ